MQKRMVHSEIGCNDIPSTANFYQQVFQWDVTSIGNSATINTGGIEAVSGHLNKLGPDKPQQYVTIFIETDTIAADLAQIEKQGGKTLLH